MSEPTPAADAFGPYRINPAFDRFPEEAHLIGKLLAGFGEIEFLMCRNAGYAADMLEDVLKALYRLRATSSRIEAADALARPRFSAAGLGSDYHTAHSMVTGCLNLRNRLAHCHWGDADTPDGGLFFTDLEESAQAVDGFEQAWHHIDVSILKSQELYFAITVEWLQFIYHELRSSRGSMPPGAWPKPPIRERPLSHNPPEKHIPPWLNEDQKARHVARAQAAQGGGPTPTPKQLALDEARAKKKARRQADRSRNLAKRSDPDS